MALSGVVGAVSRDTCYVLIGGDLGQKFGQHGRVADIAAGELLVKEAGGTMVDARGGNDSLDNGQVLACSMKMLKPLMQTVVPAWGDAAK